MKSRFVLSPEAVEDLASIWRYIQTQSSTEIADRVVNGDSAIPILSQTARKDAPPAQRH
jgi:plasmid stabilization system protein ParE